MGKARGVSRRRSKASKPSYTNRRKLINKKKRLLKRTLFHDQILKEAGNSKKSLYHNYNNFGLLYDPNKSFKVPHPIESILGKTPEEKKREKKKKELKKKKKPTEIVKKCIERALNKPDLHYYFAPDMVKFLLNMINKHNFNYEKMQMDPNNHYQLSAGEIKRKIKEFVSLYPYKD